MVIVLWREIDHRTWMRFDSEVAVAKHFSDENGWFIQCLSGGMVDGFTTAQEAMESADRNFPASITRS